MNPEMGVEEDGFTRLPQCWICCSTLLVRAHETRFELSSFADHDPDLSAYSDRRFWLRRCQECGFMQPEVLPTLPGFFDRLYIKHHAMQLRTDKTPDPNIRESMERDFQQGSKDFVFREILTRLERRVPPENRTLLDIGAHVGRFMYIAQQRGWRVAGIEPNALTSAFAAEVTQAPVHRVSARELSLGRARYGAVTLTDVLEHIPDPIDTIQTAYNLLVPGGCLMIKVPCGPGQLVKERVRSFMRKDYEFTIARNMYHVNHFCATSLRRAMERAGFKSVSVGVGAPELFVATSVTTRLRWTGANVGRLVVYYLGQFLPGGARTPLAMNLLASGLKPATAG